jgi:hypothetical protein
MPDQTKRGGYRNSETSSHERVDDPANILELRAERVVSEPIWQREVSGIVYAAAAQVWADYDEARLGQALGQRRKHAPVLEALEAVDYQHGWPAGRSPASAYIDEKIPQ